MIFFFFLVLRFFQVQQPQLSLVFGLLWWLLFVGMPYPQNLETAKEVEAIVRENGAVPATVAILDGTPCVGLYFIVIFF